MIKAGIIGASGYTGGELMRLLLGHPGVNVTVATSRKLAGTDVCDTHPHLRRLADMEFQNVGADEVRSRCDVVFAAVPHGTAMDIVPHLIDGKTKVIDLSADYRLRKDIFESVYGLSHKDPREAVFGLPELHPEVADAGFVANPGCFPTGAVLAAAPLAKAGLISSVVFDSKSGITGAGVEPSQTSHYPNMAENVQAYKLTTHRHVAEFVQELNRLDNSLTNISFTPHVVPSIRGILTTSHIFTKEKMKLEDIRSMYEEMYADKPFVRVIKGVPSLGAVRGSNFCDIGFEVDRHNNRIVVVSAIDNLVKGASGQAIQNMNIMCGFDEIEGLWNAATFP